MGEISGAYLRTLGQCLMVGRRSVASCIVGPHAQPPLWGRISRVSRALEKEIFQRERLGRGPEAS